jgi:hypothetical protein
VAYSPAQLGDLQQPAAGQQAGQQPPQDFLDQVERLEKSFSLSPAEEQRQQQRAAAAAAAPAAEADSLLQDVLGLLGDLDDLSTQLDSAVATSSELAMLTVSRGRAGGGPRQRGASVVPALPAPAARACCLPLTAPLHPPLTTLSALPLPITPVCLQEQDLERLEEQRRKEEERRRTSEQRARQRRIKAKGTTSSTRASRASSSSSSCCFPA